MVNHGSDDERFRGSIPYKILVVDGQLLLDEFADVPSQRMVEIRERLLGELDLRQADETLAASAREFVTTQI
jgi:hypothetical protein